MFAFFKRIVSRLIERLFPPKRLHRFKDVVVAGERPDNRIPYGTLVIEERGGMARWVHFLCPCGCKELRSVNLMSSRSPHWMLQRQGDRVTLHPSVWVTEGCRAHFFVRGNEIEWV